MNTLEKLINEFKTRDLNDIEYKYTQEEIDKAKFALMQEMNNSPDISDTHYSVFLREQDLIFPIKDNPSLTYLIGILFLFHKETLLANLYDIVKNHADLITKNDEVYVDNDKFLSWEFNKELFKIKYITRDMSIDTSVFDLLEEKDLTRGILSATEEVDDGLPMAVANFIYLNVINGKL